MRRVFTYLFLFSIICSSTLRLSAAVITSTTSGGNWATGSTWVGGVAPISTDEVVIATTSGNSVTLGADASCTNLTVNSGSILNCISYNLNITGNWTISGGTFNRGTGTVNFNGSSTQTLNGTTIFNNLTIASTATLSLNASITFSGNFINNGSFIPNTQTVTVQYSNTGKSIKGTSNTSFYNLTISTTASYTLTIGDATDPGNTVEVTNTFTWTTGIANQITVGNGQDIIFKVPSINIPSTATLTSTSNGTINVTGSWVNNGTFTHGSGKVLFSGASNATISGTSSTAFNNITIDKGSSTSSVIEATGAMSMAGSLTLTNGLLKLTNATSSAQPGGSMTIEATAGIEINGGTLNASNGTITNKGLFKLTTGTANIGTAAGNTLVNQGGSTFSVLDGVLNIAGRLTFTGAGTATISGGTINLATIGNTASTGSFDMSVTSNISVTGTPLITFQNACSNATPKDLYILNSTGTKTFSGGTFQFGNSSTPASQNFKINSAVALNNITVYGTNSPTATLNSSITGSNDITINSGGTLDAGSYSMNVAGNWTNNSSVSAFTYATSTVTFTGSSKTIGGTYSTSFYNLTIGTGSSCSVSINPSTGDRAKVYGTFTNSTNASLTIPAGKAIDFYGSNFINNGTITGNADSDRDIDFNNAANLSGSGSTNAWVRLYNGTYTVTLTSNHTVGGNFNIGSTTGSNAVFTTGSYTLFISGNWTNNGTFTCSTGKVTFNGNNDATISGTTTFYDLTLNKGSGTTYKLNVTSPITVSHNAVNSALTMTNGLMSLNSGGSLTMVAGQTIGASSGIQVNGGTLVAGNYSIINNGLFKVITGTANIGTSIGNSLTSQGGSTTEITGGTLNIAARMECTSTATLNINGGDINICIIGQSSSTASLSLQSNSNLSVNGGTVVIQNANGGTGNDINIASGSGTKSITGGIFQIGNSSTPVSQNFKINNPGASFYDLTIYGTNTPVATLLSNIQIGNDLSINSGATFTVVNGSNNYNMTVGGGWLNNGTFICGTGTVTLNGVEFVTQQVTISSPSSNPFYNLIINHSGAHTVNDANILVQLKSDAYVNNDLTISDGTLEGGTGYAAYTLTVGGNWINNSADDGFHRGCGIVTLTGSGKNIAGTASTYFRNLNINGSYTLTAPSLYTMSAQNSSTPTYTITADLTINASCSLNANGNPMYIGGSWYNNSGTSAFTANGNTVTFNASATYSSYIAQIIGGSFPTSFENLIINNSETAAQNVSLNTDITATGDITISDGILCANSYSINIAGNWTNSTGDSPYFSYGTGTVTFNGSSAQSMGGSNPTTFYNLISSNTSSTGTTFNNNGTVTNKLTLTDGYIYTTASNIITLTDQAYVNNYNDATSGSDASFIDGPITKIGRNKSGHYPSDYTFCFPVGKNGKWAPVTLSHYLGTVATTDAFTAEYYNSGYGTYTVTSPLDHVSKKEWWNVSKSSGNPDLVKRIYLYAKDLSFSYINDINDANLVVAHWKSATSSWENCERNANGTDYVESGDWGTFSPFTFGSKTPSNPLPVELLSFNATLNNSVTDIDWVTASEENSDYFIVERSTDMISFEDIATVDAAGISNSILNYHAVDEYPLAGVCYYRLKEVDYDGNTMYSDWVAIENNSTQNASSISIASIFPNPSSGDLINVVYTCASQNINIDIYDLQGRLLKRVTPAVTINGISTIQISISDLPQGMYVISINDGKTYSSKRFVKSE